MPDLNGLSLPELYAALSAGGLVRRLLELARDEDLGQAGDVTSAACVPRDAPGRAVIVTREDGVASGLETVPELLGVFGFDLAFVPRVGDGTRVRAGATLGEMRGSRRGILAVERTVLNLVGRLSGIATRTARFVGAIEPGVRARLYDTRKTTPGLRVLEKYAVRCGGGFNHRVGLYDAVLIKDNHLAGVRDADVGGFVAEAARRARGLRPAFIEVEVASRAQLEAVLAAGPGLVDIVLLDNMGLDDLRQAVELRDRLAPGIELEASGGVTLDTIGPIARTGVERISVGSLTHGAAALDVALDMLPEGGP
jgi:nicotinate-nucleotide pyrophosphorylase (carboxylating)